MKNNFDEYILGNLKDWLGDALCDDEISPEDIGKTIRGEIEELVTYHRDAMLKAERLLTLLQGDTSESLSDLGFSDYMSLSAVEHLEDQNSYDTINTWNFDLSSSYLDDVIKFTDNIDFDSFDNNKNK